MIKTSNFKPAWWLANPHLQTCWGTLFRGEIKLPLQRERVDLPDGDFIDLDWLDYQAKHKPNSAKNTPIILVLHGLGGSIDSHYARGIMNAIYQQGWQGVFMHHRGCSGEPNKKSSSYHSGYTVDVDFITQEIAKRFPQNPLAAVGYSLGGNILLKWLGETNSDNPLTTAVAVSVPFELNKAADRMLAGMSRVYQNYLLRKLRRHITEKFQQIPSPIDLTQVHSLQTFWEFDDKVTAPLHGFKNVMDYYSTASSRQYLKEITKPTLIIHAKDDPFMTISAIPKEKELSNSTMLELSQHGGHVGFVGGTIPGKPDYWLEQRIIRYFAEFFSTNRQKLINNLSC